MKRTLTIILTLALAMMTLAGCGATYATDSATVASSSSYDADFGWYDDYKVEESTVETAEEYNPDTDSIYDDSGVESSSRKLIKNRTMDVQTVEYDQFVADLKSYVSSFGGYIESSSESGNSYYSSSLRYADFTIRIPADYYDDFAEAVGNLATVTYSYEYVNDVTSSYVDIEARLTALKTERDSFLQLMEKAETVEEILQIQSYLTDVNYEIESYTAQLKTYDDRISYSTFYIYVSEVRRISTETSNPTVFERISSNLSDNFYDIGEGFKDAFVWIISSLPYLVLVAVPVIIVVVIVRVVVKKGKKKKAETEE
ncbi:MAG: DUF4349 domain-containing protein [Oscillospiraceae bacterium]|nr:DUF4349 domain-containing protein [Oscillospiraceae bacterium]